jgi:hypothetical protein
MKWVHILHYLVVPGALPRLTIWQACLTCDTGLSLSTATLAQLKIWRHELPTKILLIKTFHPYFPPNYKKGKLHSNYTLSKLWSGRNGSATSRVKSTMRIHEVGWEVQAPSISRQFSLVHPVCKIWEIGSDSIGFQSPSPTMPLRHQEAKSYMPLLMSPTVTQQSILPVIDHHSHLCSDSAMKLNMSMMIPMVIGLIYYYLSCCKTWAMQSPNVGSQKAINQAGEWQFLVATVIHTE